MAITSWTSEGMDWSSLQHKRLYPYVEALRLALVERATIAGVPIIPLLQNPVATGKLLLYNYGSGWGYEFESVMDDLIEVYINHTLEADFQNDLVSSYSDANNTPNFWIEANLLTEIGAPSRIRLASGQPPLADWAIQQYKLLNELRWTIIWGPNLSTVSSGYEEKEGVGATFAAAVADYNGNGWVPATNTSNYLWYKIAKDTAVTPIYYIRRRTRNFTLTGWNTSINHTMDFYGYLSGPGNYDPRPGSVPTTFSEYEDPNFSTTYPGTYIPGSMFPGRIVFIQSWDTPNNNASELCSDWNKIDINTLTDFGALPSGYDNQQKGWEALSNPRSSQPSYFFGHAVMKWDVTGGFNFVA